MGTSYQQPYLDALLDIADVLLTIHPILTAIQITAPPALTQYAEGAVFNPEGMAVTAFYSDGSSKAVTGWSVAPDTLSRSDTAVTVTYTEARRSVCAKVSIVVVAPHSNVTVVFPPLQHRNKDDPAANNLCPVMGRRALTLFRLDPLSLPSFSVPLISGFASGARKTMKLDLFNLDDDVEVDVLYCIDATDHEGYEPISALSYISEFTRHGDRTATILFNARFCASWYNSDFPRLYFIFRKGAESFTVPYHPKTSEMVYQEEYPAFIESDAQTQYEWRSHAGTVTSIPFGDAGTVYAGSLDVSNGILTVTHGCIDSYAGESVPDGWVSSSGELSIGAQVVYPLDQPLVYQLPPTTIPLNSDGNPGLIPAFGSLQVRWMSAAA